MTMSVKAKSAAASTGGKKMAAGARATGTGENGTGTSRTGSSNAGSGGADSGGADSGGTSFSSADSGNKSPAESGLEPAELATVFANSLLAPGTYRHFKGRRYRVLGTARHTETGEWLVVYQSLYGAHDVWVRPLSMFTETVEHGGEPLPRFQRLEEGE
jgi:hypothetical protein